MTDAPAGLSVLVETERRLEAELTAARREAARLEQEGAAEAARLEQALLAELAAAGQALEERLGAEEEQARVQVAADAERDVAIWETDEAEVSALAGWVVARIVGGEPA